MRLIIDIPEQEYRRVKDGKWYGNGLADYIENGTPLPKGHGRLIDADELFEEVGNIRPQNKVQYKDIGRFMNMITYSPTIIEADKEGKTK